MYTSSDFFVFFYLAYICAFNKCNSVPDRPSYLGIGRILIKVEFNLNPIF